MLQSAITLPAMPRKPLPPSEKKAALGARVDPALLAALQAMADEDDRTVSYMVEKAVREFIERHTAKPPADRQRKRG